MAGWDWVVGFKNPNSNICLRKPQATSAARAMAFNKPQVTKCFDVYRETLKGHNVSPTRISNVDESSLSIVLKIRKILHKL
jgi:hypothetical protein